MLHLYVGGHEVGILVPADPSKRNQPDVMEYVTTIEKLRVRNLSVSAVKTCVILTF